MKHNILKRPGAKRLWALALLLLLVLGAMPLSASAAGTDQLVTDSAGLTAAIAAGGKVTLGGGFTVETEESIAALTIGDGKSVTLDLKGHTLTAPGTVSKLFQVEAGTEPDPTAKITVDASYKDIYCNGLAVTIAEGTDPNYTKFLVGGVSQKLKKEAGDVTLPSGSAETGCDLREYSVCGGGTAKRSRSSDIELKTPFRAF